MKRILSLFAGAVLCATAIAQHGPMAFVGPSRFGVESMNAWQDNESDVVFLQVNGATDADITLPKMVYAAMNMTLPSFTIHGATFTYDMETRSVVFDEQTYSETIVVDDVEKAITGTSLTATYSHSDNTLSLTTRFSYGSMPMEITYIIENAVYDSSVTGNECSAATSAGVRPEWPQGHSSRGRTFLSHQRQENLFQQVNTRLWN